MPSAGEMRPSRRALLARPCRVDMEERARMVRQGCAPAARGVRFQPSQPRSTRAESQSWWEPGCARNAVSRWRPTSSYICCADATLQWRCQSCGKVSEGFAFPYGMCPHCGGSLRVLERAGVSDEASLNAIRTAFQIELGGKAFYERAADQVADPVLKALFTKFSAMEHEHMETLSRRYHVQPPDPAEGFRVDIAAIQAGVEGDIADPETLFRMAITFEKRAVDFFSKRANAVPEGSTEQDLYKELAAEEVEHVALLETEFQRWSKGRAGMLASESRKAIDESKFPGAGA